MIELIKEILFGVNDPNTHQAFLPAAMAIGGIAQMAMGYDWGGKRKKALAKQRAAYEEQKDVFRGLDTSNAFAGLENRYAGMDNQYRDTENTMEDLTVNTQQAEFEQQMFGQSQANTLQSLRGAAGSSGIAGLAQVMANQSQSQAQQASASIGKQEARNKLLMAQQAAKNDQLLRGESARIDQIGRQGASQVDQLKAQGQLQSMQMEQSKQSTLLGMDAQGVQGAQNAVQAGNQMMASGFSNVIGGVGGAASAAAGDPNFAGKLKFY